MTSETSDGEMIVETTAEPLQQILKKAAGLNAAPEVVKRRSTKPVQTMPFRPLGRQPLAFLTVLDDGSRDEGEVIRLRQSAFTIGREKGDLTIPFDHDISAFHVELRCRNQRGKCRWYLIDQGSRNGTFLRAYRASLSREVELLLGNRRYAFRSAQAPESENANAILETSAYQAPTSPEMEQMHARLSEIGTSDRTPQNFVLPESEHLLGRSSQCSIRIPDDPFLSPEHARLYRDERDRWMIADSKSLNGVWIRIQKMPLDRQAEFQIGRQRFLFRPHAAQS